MDVTPGGLFDGPRESIESEHESKCIAATALLEILAMIVNFLYLITRKVSRHEVI